MPADTSATDYKASRMDAAESRTNLPAGAGIAIGVTVGAAIWAGILALFLM